MTTKTDLHSIPAALADVAFLDIKDVCAAVRMSTSWVHDEVRAGRFPAPMRFGPRCSRWRSADIRLYLIARAESPAVDANVAAMVAARAKKASAAAQTARQGVTLRK
jgi:prophage regulatory protein